MGRSGSLKQMRREAPGAGGWMLVSSSAPRIKAGSRRTLKNWGAWKLKVAGGFWKKAFSRGRRDFSVLFCFPPERSYSKVLGENSHFHCDWRHLKASARTCTPKSPTSEQHCRLPRGLWVRGFPAGWTPMNWGTVGRNWQKNLSARSARPSLPGFLKTDGFEPLWSFKFLFCPVWSVEMIREGPRLGTRGGRIVFAQWTLKNLRKQAEEKKNASAMGPMSCVVPCPLGVAFSRCRERHEEHCGGGYGMVAPQESFS